MFLGNINVSVTREFDFMVGSKSIVSELAHIEHYNYCM